LIKTLLGSIICKERAVLNLIIIRTFGASILLALFRKMILSSIVLGLSACVSINTVPNAGGQNAQKKNDSEDIVREKKVSLDEAANFNMSLGAQYLKNGKLNQAIAKLEKAITQAPTLTLAHSYLGLAYEKIGETARANTHYSKAVALEADNPVSANNYGTFLCRQNDQTMQKPNSIF